MRKFYFAIFILIIGLSGCVTVKPKDFTYLYTAGYTGLDTLINIDGYYVAQRECDSTFSSVFMFYPDGLFTIATTSDVSNLKDCFENGGKSNLCQYPSWGTYRIEGNTIKTQTIRQEGMGISTIFRDYEIGDAQTLINISDYVVPQNTNLGYMKDYPSFLENQCPEVATFYPLGKKRSEKDCPLLNKKWFNQNK
ncbi:hypothetical protein CLV62_12272 [Dysgonomonas alginatilytica]|uniref:Lipoprotein n=1 Tax=Dysgonomonas alginatilytica TaxID=1605892 RepID=A0A2V3PN71_9BACT|nr:hypothetical protein [Dysgonomonas alginatilytica]PXV62117.1 hypothetical protein CLV62_12272 [Dysgonomonas alginatilytica]